MSLTNAEVRQQLQQLAETAQRAEADLARSDDLPPMDLAQVTVELDKLSGKASKLADRIAKLAAPLFGPNGQGGAEQSSKPSGGRKGKK